MHIIFIKSYNIPVSCLAATQNYIFFPIYPHVSEDFIASERFKNFDY